MNRRNEFGRALCVYLGYVLLIIACVGCGSTEIVSPEIAEQASGLTAFGQKIETKQDAILKAVKDNDNSIKAVWIKLEALDLTLATLKPQTGKDGDPQSSPSPPESPAKANTQQPPVQVATPGTSSFRTASDGTVLRWNINGNWNPTILETSAHLAAEHGIDTNGMTHQQMADSHADLHDGKPVAMKAKPVQYQSRPTYSVQSGCPGGVCPTNTRFVQRRRR